MLTEVHNDNSPLNHSLTKFNNIFPTTFMFGSSYLRLCEHKHRIVTNCFLRPPSATRNSVVIVVIVIVVLLYPCCYYCFIVPLTY